MAIFKFPHFFFTCVTPNFKCMFYLYIIDAHVRIDTQFCIEKINVFLGLKILKCLSTQKINTAIP